MSDDDDPIYPIQIVVENGAELSEPKRASISRDRKIAKTSGKFIHCLKLRFLNMIKRDGIFRPALCLCQRVVTVQCVP